MTRPIVGRLLGQHDPARQQQVGGAGEADEAGEHPRQAVLGGQPEAAVDGGELGAGGGEAEVGVAGEHEADAGGGAVDRGDDREAQAVVEGEGVVELRPHAVAGLGQRLADAGVVRALLDVAVEGGAVGAGAEARGPCPVTTSTRTSASASAAATRLPVLGVHPPGPRVEPVGPGEGDRGDAVGDRVLDRSCSSVTSSRRRQRGPSTSSASSGRQISRSGSHGSGWL